MEENKKKNKIIDLGFLGVVYYPKKKIESFKGG